VPIRKGNDGDEIETGRLFPAFEELFGSLVFLMLRTVINP
jgi:hypothetical protein